MPLPDQVKHTLTECQALHANGRYQQAETLALWCIAQSQLIEDDLLLFRSYSALGHVLRASERFTEALNVLTTALTLAQTKLGDEQVAIAWNSIGGLFLGGCAWQLALECFYKIIADASLCNTADAYKAHGNIALSHLYCGNITLGLSAICQALRMAPADLLTTSPYSYTFMRNTLVQLALRSDRIAPNELSRAVAEARHCRSLHPENRSVDLLCDLIEGSAAVAYGQDRQSGLKQLYLALQKACYAHELMTDVLGCLVQAEFLAGHPDKMERHLEAWIARTYEDAGWQATEKLGLHDPQLASQVVQAQWPELALGDKKLEQCLKSAPPLQPGVADMFSAWIGCNATNAYQDMMSADYNTQETETLLFLKLMAEGFSYPQIAKRLGISTRSVKRIIRRLFQAKGIDSHQAAITYWRQHYEARAAAAVKEPGSLGWYYHCMLQHQFETALDQWYHTPPSLRHKQAQLTICIMLCLLNRESAMERESVKLPVKDAQLFQHFNEWWQGCGESGKKLTNLITQSGMGYYLIRLAQHYGQALRQQHP